MATLYHLGTDGAKAEWWELGEGPIVVGRSGQATVNIPDDGLSRRHFLVLREGGDYLIKDLSSRNGTWVDGRRIVTERLRDNQRILAGNTLFLFAEQPALSPTVPNAPMGPHDTVVISPRKSAAA